MTRTIEYVTGIPRGDIHTLKFEDTKIKYNLTDKKSNVWEYIGPFTENDFDALALILTSDEYHLLLDSVPNSETFEKTITSENKEKAISLAERVISGKSQLNKTSTQRNLDSLAKTSADFMPIFKELFDLSDDSPYYNAAKDHIENKYKTANPISFTYSHNNITNLTEDTKALIFIDDVLEGEVVLNDVKSIHDHFVGPADIGTATIKMGELSKSFYWSNWDSHFESFIDPKVRREFLKETPAGMIHYKL
jgi:hypothetical protein